MSWDQVASLLADALFDEAALRAKGSAMNAVVAVGLAVAVVAGLRSTWSP